MPADALHIGAAAEELHAKLSGGRIDKINMPDPYEIVLSIHNRENFALVLSADPSLPRAHLSAHPPKNNPLRAPAFLMHLRKHIGGALIESVRAQKGERILFFALRARDELGYAVKRTLICEVMGKYANVILTDESGKISECLKHISPADSEKRPVMPGSVYSLPPVQDKADIFDAEALRALLDGFTGGKADSYILAGAAGLSPATIAAVVTHTLGGVYFDALSATQKDALVAAFSRQTLCKNAKPCVRRADGKSDFWIYPFYPDGDYTFFPTLNQAMDAHFDVLDRDRRLREKSRVPKTAVKNAVARTEKKLKLFAARQQEAADAAQDKLFGELITANIYRIRQGMQSVVLENYYTDPPSPVTVPLQENKSPQYNAQAYYKKYAKKKKALEITIEQIRQATADLEYYHSVLDSFSYTDEEGLEEIVNELYAANLLHAPKDAKKKKKEPAGGHAVIDGCTVRWGKTNYQNDRLTKQARPDDVWLHTQKIHGSHVIVSGDNITQQVLLRAAAVAAYYSKARYADNVPVDYTRKKYVNKPKGAAPGKVIYTDCKTLFVTPQDIP